MIIFDLDNTLYDVEQYFTGALWDVSDYLAVKYGIIRIDFCGELIALWKEKTSMYPHLFDDVLSDFGIGDGELEVVIEVFNNHNPKIEPYTGVVSVLQELNDRGYKLGIITDGNVRRQKRKIDALNIGYFFDTVVFTEELDHPKPSPIPYQKALDELNATPHNSFYIGDNPVLDFKGAKEVGMRTVRVLTGEFKNISSDESVDHEIEELKELLNIIGGAVND